MNAKPTIGIKGILSQRALESCLLTGRSFATLLSIRTQTTTGQSDGWKPDGPLSKNHSQSSQLSKG